MLGRGVLNQQGRSSIQLMNYTHVTQDNTPYIMSFPETPSVVIGSRYKQDSLLQTKKSFQKKKKNPISITVEQSNKLRKSLVSRLIVIEEPMIKVKSPSEHSIQQSYR